MTYLKQNDDHDLLPTYYSYLKSIINQSRSPSTSDMQQKSSSLTIHSAYLSLIVINHHDQSSNPSRGPNQQSSQPAKNPIQPKTIDSWKDPKKPH